MQRLRAEDGYLGYIGMLAALVIVGVLMVTSLKLIGGSGVSGSGASGAANDAAAEAEVAHAFSALQRCAAKQGGSFDGCADQIVENEPTLAPAAGRIKAVTAGSSAQVSVASSTGNAFTIAVDRGVTIRPCSKLGVGACPATGRW